MRPKTKAKLKNCWEVVGTLFADYSNHSTIHGVNYLTETGRSWFERTWWTAAVCVSVFCCGKLISDAWNINPIIITFTGKPTPIWKIPFPAVSLCPSGHTHYKHMNLTPTVYNQCMGLASQTQTAQLHAVRAICLDELIHGRPETYPPTCNDCVDFLRDVRIPPEDLFIDCKFQNQKINCLDSVQETVTSIAMCYTFNGIDRFRRDSIEDDRGLAEEWSIDEGYKTPGTVDMYPRRALGTGPQFGFSTLLRMSRHDFDYGCSLYPGFYLEYRTPYDDPDVSTKFFLIRMGTAVDVILKPTMITTAKEVRDYPVAERKCYLSTERRLKYFKQYTQTNCEVECKADYVLKTCGCLLIHLEKRKGFDICGYRVIRACLGTSEMEVMKTISETCECLPTCTTITYNAEIAVNPMNLTDLSNSQEEYEFIQLNIYFKDPELMTSERRERYGTTDFLANCGGLLGLFLGISVISFVEILYFCTVRLWCSLKQPNNATIVDPAEIDGPHIGRNKRYLKVLKDLITDYSSQTSIQGLNYVADSSLSFYERCWWTIVIVMSALCCGSLILDAVGSYDQSPLIVSYANEETPVSQIPFPAITICPQMVGPQVKQLYFQLKRYNKTRFYSESPQTKDLVTALSQICDPAVFRDLDPDNKTDCGKCGNYIHSIFPKAYHIIRRCLYRMRILECYNLFENVITAEGICYTFNGIDIHRQQNEEPTDNDPAPDWTTLDDGYANDSVNFDVYPRRGSRLSVNLFLQIDRYRIDDTCKDPIQGYKVYVHMPNESPQITKHYYIAPYDNQIQFFVDPKVITTAPEVRGIPVSKRHCYFNEERYLRFFKFYTQNNCVEECVANLTLSKCGCLRLHIPKVPGVKICGIGEMSCYQQVVQLSIEQNIDQSQSSGCHCLPTCNSITYDMEVNQIVLSREAIKFLDDDYVATRRYNCVEAEESFGQRRISFAQHRLTNLVVAFKQHQFIAMERMRLYGPTELVANFGGLLGLFLGFSLMSVLELIYFCTIRLVCNFRQLLL